MKKITVEWLREEISIAEIEWDTEAFFKKLADHINSFIAESEKIMGKCEYCQKIHDLRIACPEYYSIFNRKEE